MDKKDLQSQATILINLYNSKRFEDTIQKGKILIKKFPNQLIFYNATALALSALGKNEEALKILKSALNLKPNDIFVLNNLGLIKSHSNQNKQSREYLEKAISINPNFMDALLNLGNLDLKEGKTEDAKKHLFNALKLSKSPETDVTINIALGNLHQQLGEFEKAMENYKIVNKINPLNAAADKSISIMHKYLSQNDPHLLSMTEKINRIKDKENLKLLYFSIGKAYEDIEDYEKSFKFIKLGNDIADEQINYNIQDDKNLFSELKKIFQKKIFDKIDNPQKKIIFILGMPRSGTTLIEQIISSHKDVCGAGELSYLEDGIKNLINFQPNKGEKFWKKLTDFNEFNYDKLKLLQSEYIDKLNAHNYKEEVITDKAPLNFRWIGFIKSIFPNSKIIHCIRDGMDICYSNFKNAFSGGSLGFCYNLDKLGNYYNFYKDLMSFWKGKFKDEIYDLSYEKLVNNNKEEIERLLDFCELEWDENCLYHHKNKKVVATASLAQVRVPVYKSSINKWKNVENQLVDLKKIIN